jgi:hypothetical protein
MVRRLMKTAAPDMVALLVMSTRTISANESRPAAIGGD